jgi:hypothetical protein
MRAVWNKLADRVLDATCPARSHNPQSSSVVSMSTVSEIRHRCQPSVCRFASKLDLLKGKGWIVWPELHTSADPLWLCTLTWETTEQIIKRKYRILPTEMLFAHLISKRNATLLLLIDVIATWLCTWSTTHYKHFQLHPLSKTTPLMSEWGVLWICKIWTHIVKVKQT